MSDTSRMYTGYTLTPKPAWRERLHRSRTRELFLFASGAIRRAVEATKAAIQAVWIGLGEPSFQFRLVWMIISVLFALGALLVIVLIAIICADSAVRKKATGQERRPVVTRQR